MTLKEKIQGLQNLTGYYVCRNKFVAFPDGWTGSKTDYIVYVYSNNKDGNDSDNLPWTETTTIQINYFTKRKNYDDTVRQIKNYLKLNEFVNIYKREFYEDDTKITHIVFECDHLDYYSEV